VAGCNGFVNRQTTHCGFVSRNVRVAIMIMLVHIAFYLLNFSIWSLVRKAWRYQRSIQKRESEEWHTTQWPKGKGQTDKQWETKHYTENDRSSHTNPTKTEGELRCSGSVCSSCSTCGTRGIVISMLYGVGDVNQEQYKHFKSKTW
jgi:hypothetical protein